MSYFIPPWATERARLIPAYLGVNDEDFRGNGRQPNEVQARSITAFCLNKCYGPGGCQPLSLIETTIAIGRSDRSHTTAQNAIRRFVGLLNKPKCELFPEQLASVEKLLEVMAHFNLSTEPPPLVDAPVTTAPRLYRRDDFADWCEDAIRAMREAVNEPQRKGDTRLTFKRLLAQAERMVGTPSA